MTEHKQKRILDLVEVPCEEGAYYQTTITTSDGQHGTATIEGLGRVAVYKEMCEWPVPHPSFAWKIDQAQRVTRPKEARDAEA